MINSIMLIIYGLAMIALSMYLIAQWYHRLAAKTIIRGTFKYFHRWFGGILGITGVVLGIASLIIAVITMN